MNNHAVVIAGAGPTGLMLAGELALARIPVAIVERREDQQLAGMRAGGLQSRTIEVLDQRGIAERFLAEGKVMQVAGFALNPLDISDFPTRHNYGLALTQNHIERILAAWIEELLIPIYRGREVTSFAQDSEGVDVALSDGTSLRAQYLVGCDGGRSLIRKHAGIDFPGWAPSVTYLIAEVDMAEEPPRGVRHGERGINAIGRIEGSERVRVVLVEPQVEQGAEPTEDDLRRALSAVYGTDYGLHHVSWLSRFSDWKLAQVVHGSSPDSLLDTYQAERHPVATRVLRNTLSQTALARGDERTAALRENMAELLRMEEPRKRYAAMMSGLDIHYDLGAGHPLLGRRMPDLDLVTESGTKRVFNLLHAARPLLLNFGNPDSLDIAPWAERVRWVNAQYAGSWELPALGTVTPPSAVLIRPDGHVAWVGDGTDRDLREALNKWFGAPA